MSSHRREASLLQEDAVGPPKQHAVKGQTVSRLAIIEYLAIATYCRGFGWLKALKCVGLENGCGYEHCTSSNMVMAAIILGCNIFVPVFWIIGEWIILPFNMSVNNEIATGRAWQRELDAWEKRQGKVPGNERVPVHPASWNDALRSWKSSGSQNSSVLNKNIYWRALRFYVFFMFVGYVLILLILAVAPQGSGEQSYFQPLVGLLTFHVNGLFDVLLLIVMAWELLLFVFVTISVRWPAKRPDRPDSFDNLTQEAGRANRIQQSQERNVVPGLIPDVALLIACHESCLTEERQASFQNTLLAAMRLFPANAIFVCDNGRDSKPVDRTEEVCDKLSRELYGDGMKINYLYIPEGNKTHAMYWTTEFWIPELVKQGIVPDFRWALLIDDDVPLPPDLQVPLQTLNENPDIKAVAYAISAAVESGKSNLLVNLQDAEYKVVNAVKQFQAKHGTAMYCHGAIGLWRRDDLGKKILWDHDTEFHGEDMYMGLLLHRMKRNYRILCSAEAVVPTFAPESIWMLFRQRSTSWDLCVHRKVYTLGKILLINWTSQTLILKPFIFYELMVVFLDYIRIYMVAGLAFRNPLGLLLVIGVFYGMAWMQLLLFNLIILRHRPDLRLSIPTLLVYPFYKTFSLGFRYHALLRNILKYVTWNRKKKTIHTRFEAFNDIPPVPKAGVVKDWYTVSNTGQRHQLFSCATPASSQIWQESQETAPEQHTSASKLRDFLDTEIVRHLQHVSAGNKARVLELLEAYYRHEKLKLEFRSLKFPAIIKNVGLSSRSVEEPLEMLDAAMGNAVQQVLQTEYVEVSRLMNALVETANKERRHVLLTYDLVQGLQSNNREGYRTFLLKVREAIRSIGTTLDATKYPQHNNEVAGAEFQLRAVTAAIDGCLQHPAIASVGGPEFKP